MRYYISLSKVRDKNFH